MTALVAPRQDRLLLASLHDVSPLFESEADCLYDRLSVHVGQGKVALLVIPDHWQQAPIRPGSPFATRVRRWADLGNEIFLHGWTHLDRVRHRSLADRLRGHLLTAREGEFLGIDKGHAMLRLRDGRSLLEDIIGRPVAGFVAPAWLYGAAAISALTELEFPVCEDHFRVWEPASGRTLSRGPVITWASRSWVRAQSSVGFAALARRMLNAMRDVRIAVHPGDLSRPELCRSIEATLACFARDRRPARYGILAERKEPQPRLGGLQGT